MLKHEKQIIIRCEHLRKLRNNLRQILILSVYGEIDILDNFDSLYEGWLDLTPEEQKEVPKVQF